MASKPKRPSEFFEFYEGKIVMEKKPWGDFYRFYVDGRTGVLSATRVTANLDKSRALLPWAVGLVGGHMTTYIENSTAEHFTKEEIAMVVSEAILKPEEAKIKGGKSGDEIHDFALAFANHKKFGTPLPSIDHLDDKDPEQARALNGINAFLDWYTNNDVEFLEMEKPVYYNSFLAGDTKEGEDIVECLGIMDVLARVNGVVKVMDYKTGKRVYNEQRYQLSFYRKAWNSDPQNKDVFAEKSEVLNFSKDTGELVPLEISTEESDKDFKAFAGLYAVGKREQELDKR